MDHEEQKKCHSVSEWWDRFGDGCPVQVPGIIERLMKERDMSFLEAYEFVCEREMVLEQKGKEYVDELLEFLKQPKH